MRRVTEVAVGVMIDGAGRFLMAGRPEGKPFAGWWEFPGGKLEVGETVLQALVREYAEELGVTVEQASPWFVFERDYPHAYVRLHVCRITGWRGQPQSREGQRFAWFDSLQGALSEKLLPMCDVVIERLRLPARVARVRRADDPALAERFAQSRAQGILCETQDAAQQALARTLGVPLIVCPHWFSEPQAVEALALQESLVGALRPTVDARAVLLAAEQRLPLYVPEREGFTQQEALRLGAQGVYVEI